MNVVVCISDELAAKLDAGPGLERQALEALVLEGFRAARITKHERRDALGFSVLNEVDGFLKSHDLYEDYTMEEIDDQVQTLERLGL